LRWTQWTPSSADFGPHRLIARRLWARAAFGKIEVFHDYALVALLHHHPARPTNGAR
jgi:hypothetical protein